MIYNKEPPPKKKNSIGNSEGPLCDRAVHLHGLQTVDGSLRDHVCFS